MENCHIVGGDLRIKSPQSLPAQHVVTARKPCTELNAPAVPGRKPGRKPTTEPSSGAWFGALLVIGAAVCFPSETAAVLRALAAHRRRTATTPIRPGSIEANFAVLPKAGAL